MLHRVLVHADEILAHNDRNLYTSIEYLRDATENLKAAARQVRTNPPCSCGGMATSKHLTPPTAPMRPRISYKTVARWTVR